MSEHPCKFFHQLIKLTDLFDPDFDSSDSYSDSSDGNKYYIVDGDESIGFVLFFSMHLRDGAIVVFVDDSGHTQVIDTFKKSKAYKNCYLAQMTEDYHAIINIHKEFDRNYYGPYHEIHRLRKLLGNNDASK